MKITDKLSLKDYDEHCLKNLPRKIPDIKKEDNRGHVGDCIYHFKDNEIKMRPGVHGLSNKETDLNGKYALLSDHYYYFGDNPIDLKEELYPIIKKGQGHKSKFNIPYEKLFLDWIEELDLIPNKLYGKPQIEIDFSKRKKEVEIISKERLQNCLEDEEECRKGIC
jgi:hypothetical protein